MTSVLSYALVAAAACGVPHFLVWATKVGYRAVVAVAAAPTAAGLAPFHLAPPPPPWPC